MTHAAAVGGRTGPKGPPVFGTPPLLVQLEELTGQTEVVVLGDSNNGTMPEWSIRVDRSSAQQ